MFYEKKSLDLEDQLKESSKLNDEFDDTIKKLKEDLANSNTKKKCPLDKNCKSEGNILGIYRTHQVLHNCPVYKQV